MYYSLNGKDYYWDGKYWREREGDEVSNEITQELNNRYPEAKDKFAGDPGDRIFVYGDSLYFYDSTTDQFRDPLKTGMELPRAVKDALRRMLAEPEEETMEFNNLGEIHKAAIAAKDNKRFSRVEKLCRLGFENFGVDPMLAAMYCRALRELNRSREASEWGWEHKDKKWPHLLASLTGALIDASKTREDLEKAEETLELYQQSGGADFIGINMLRKGLDKRWREIR